ncbi:WD40-repeat-containing domain protein [Earliella scabrosa]|nr:WD40-repeat-containing domain protein [Earliella scabrosa]
MDTPSIVEHRIRCAWDIYAEALYPLGHGYPLWNPSIDPTASVVDLCDVGWLKKGGLMQLFNARRNANEQPVRRGVPPSFVPFNPPNLPASGPAQRWGPSLLCSRHTSVVDAALAASAETEDGASLPLQVASGERTYSVSLEAESGAFLDFGPCAESRDIDIEGKRHIVAYIRENLAHWYDFATNMMGYELQEDDLFFISGTTLTTSWTVAAFHEQRVHGPRSRGRTPAALGVAGTESELKQPANQCIFIHYYKAKRRTDHPSAMTVDVDGELTFDIDIVPDSLDIEALGCETVADDQVYDPVKDLLDYILANSEASMAIASDRDLYSMFKDQEFPHDIARALRERNPQINVDEYGVGTVALDLPPESLMPGDAMTLNDPSAEEGLGDAPPGDAAPNEQRLQQVAAGHAPTLVHDGAVTALAYSPDGGYAASGSEDTTIIVWNAHENSPMYQKSDYKDTVSALAFSRDGRILATGSNDEEIIIWQVHGGVKMRTIKNGVPIHALGYTPDGSMLIAGGYDGSLSIYNAETYEPMATIRKHFAVITFIVFSPDGRFMATGGTESEAHVWELASLGQGVPKSSLQGHKGMVCNVAFSPDGRRIITASDDGSSRVWKAETGEAHVILHEHTGPVWCVAFSADGKQVASGSSDSTVKICDSYSGERALSLDGHDNMINSVAFSPGGKFIASAASDNTVRLWNAEDGSLTATFNEHSDNVTTVMFGPDDATLASGSHDGTVRIRTITDI